MTLLQQELGNTQMYAEVADLLKHMLHPDPADRCSMYEALEHSLLKIKSDV